MNEWNQVALICVKLAMSPLKFEECHPMLIKNAALSMDEMKQIREAAAAPPKRLTEEQIEERWRAFCRSGEQE